MQLGPLTISLHRTVRVAEGRTPANLPPNLGVIKTYPVAQYRERCPELWEDSGVFIGLHDTEALWLSFHTKTPVALLVGAGSLNALTGKPLGTKLEADNYCVVPPQPWLDGWKADNGAVYQFVATPYEKGQGKTVAEQVLKEKSQTGGIGLALFESKSPLQPKAYPGQTVGDDPYGPVSQSYTSAGPGSMPMAMPNSILRSAKKLSPTGLTGQTVNSGPREAFTEMGLGKGGQIKQKVYADPYGLEVWQELPSQTRAIYIVHAALLAEITGEPIQPPVAQGAYSGAWFDLHDQGAADVPGSPVFTGLQSVFATEDADVPATKDPK